jgi:sugar transferase EpsL
MARRFSRAVKRGVDVAGASLGLLLLAPLLGLTAALIRLSMGAPVLFRQVRPGLGGRPFTLVKFRTMSEGHAADGSPLPDSARLTQLGRVLRAVSLDELPQLWNVLRGDMSLVGPRPLLVRYLSRYTPEQARRHEVRPGITGWAQVHGHPGMTWSEKLAHDVWYVENWSLGLDARILALTVGYVLRRRGSSSARYAALPEFTGKE